MNGAGRGRVWVIALLLVVLHFFLHVGLSIGRGAPDLSTLALLLLAREMTVGRAAVVGLLLGLLEDALSVLAFGANSLAMTVVGIGGSVTRDLFVGDSRLFLLSYVFLGKWTRDLVHWVSVREGLRQPFVEQVVIEGSIAAAYLALVGLMLVGVLPDGSGEA